MKIVKNIQKLSHEIVVYAKDVRKSHLTLHWSAENVKIDKTNFSLRNTIPLHGMNKTNDERCYTAAVWTQISIPPLQVRGALNGGWGGCFCQWELKVFTDRSRNDCVHEQVAMLGPVSRAAGMDCECPLDSDSDAVTAEKQKQKATVWSFLYCRFLLYNQ